VEPSGSERVVAPEAPAWHRWSLFALIWAGVLLLMGVLNLGIYSALGSGRPLEVLAAFAWSPLIGILVVPSAMVVALLRGLWLRLAPTRVRDATSPAVVLGALSAPLGLLALLSLGEPSMWSSPAASHMGALGALLPTTLVNGAAAGYLAHHRLSPRDGRWWAWLLGSVAVGLLLLALLDPRFPARR
jgi:hypothetical protein